jgi:C-terminal processing protease CtpA/Prc
MRRSIALMLLLAVPLGAVQSITLQPAQLQQDFDVLKRALEEAHGGLYRYTPKAELDKAFAASRARLDRAMTPLEFGAVLSEALAWIRDGHTRLEYDEATTKALSSARLIPLRVAHEGGRLIVVSNDSSADRTIRPGMEIVSVNGRAVADVVGAIAATMPADGFIGTGKAWRLARGFAQNYWLYVEQTSSFTVTAKDDSGRTVSASLEGVTNADRAKVENPVNAELVANLARLEGSRDNVSLSFPNGGDVGLLRVRAFDGDTFVASLEKAFVELRDRKTSGLVLDLRGNGGGVDMYGSALVSHFVTTAFRYFDRIKVTTVAPSFATWNPGTSARLKSGTRPAPDAGFLIEQELHPGVAEQKPAAVTFGGKVVVLIDGGSFSTTADVAAQLRSRTQAMFIGEETAGAAEGNTSGLNAQVTLPTSGLRLKIQMYGYWNALGTTGRAGAPALRPGRGTLPDVTLVRTVANVLAGVDPVLERAMALLRNPK